MADFIFLGSKITADADCSHEIKRHLLLGKKVMTNLDSILRSRQGGGKGGSGWGIHVNPWLIHVNVWKNSLQYCKVISLQLIKINEEKKKKQRHYFANKGPFCQGYGFSNGHVWM